MRKEIRFEISYSEYQNLKQFFNIILKKDENSMMSGEYSIKTIYFDNCYRKIENDKKNDINSVYKYRIRMYNNDDKNIFLERKTNENGYIKKIKEKIPKKDVIGLLNGRFENLLTENESLKTELYLKMQLEFFRTSLLIEYIREAWVDKISNARITIDKELKSTTNCTKFFDEIKSIPKEKYILEVKYDKYLPDYILNIIQTVKGKKVTKSKFLNEVIKYSYGV